MNTQKLPKHNKDYLLKTKSKHFIKWKNAGIAPIINSRMRIVAAVAILGHHSFEGLHTVRQENEPIEVNIGKEDKNILQNKKYSILTT
jgi:hypothetical protein